MSPSVVLGLLLPARHQRLESVDRRRREREGERFGNTVLTDGLRDTRRERERGREIRVINICAVVNRFGKERGTPGCGNVAKVGLGVGRVGY